MKITIIKKSARPSFDSLSARSSDAAKLKNGKAVQKAKQSRLKAKELKRKEYIASLVTIASVSKKFCKDKKLNSESSAFFQNIVEEAMQSSRVKNVKVDAEEVEEIYKILNIIFAKLDDTKEYSIKKLISKFDKLDKLP